MPKALSGFLDDGRGEPLADIPAVATILGTSTVVDTTMTDADGHWLFSGLPTADEYVVTLSDTAGNSVARAPWSGEMRELWVRDRLDVTGLPLLLDPAAGNSLLWTVTGLYAPTGITLAAADLRYEPLDSAYTKAEADARYEPIDTMYTKVESDARYPQKTDLDPYPQYLTPLEATGLYEPLDSAYTKAEADARYEPFDSAYTKAEADARYEPLDSAYTKAEDDARFLQLTGGSVMTGLLGPTTTNTRDLGTTALRWRKLWAVDGEFTNAPTVSGVAVLTATSAGLLYEPLDSAYTKAEDDARFVNLAGGSVMTGLLGPTTNNTRDLGTTALRWRKVWGVDADLSGALTVTTGPLTVSAGGMAVTGASTFSVAPTVGGSSLLTATAGDTAYVNATSDTMSGTLGVGGLLTASAGLAVTGAATISSTLSVNSRPVIMAGCRVYNTTAQTITTATATALAFNTERYDTDTFHDTVTNNTRLTVSAGLAGKYHIWASVGWAPVADATWRFVGLRLNGTTQIGRQAGPNMNSASVWTFQNVSVTYDLVVGDYVECIVRHDRGSNLDTLIDTNNSPEFGWHRIG